MIFRTLNTRVESVPVAVTVEDYLKSLATGTPLVQQRQAVVNNIETYTTTFSDNDEQVTKLSTYQEALLKTLEAQCLQVLVERMKNPDTSFSTFKIPKRTGGLREITAPSETLKVLYRDIVTTLKRLDVAPSNNAHAYVAGRSTKTCMEKHQANESKWFLKVDIKNFFGSFSPIMIKHILRGIYPFNLAGDKILETLAAAACLGNGLPQGTPLSPYLTNLLMIPFDYTIQNLAYNTHMVYTRYADDIIVSSQTDFPYRDLEKQIDVILYEKTKTKLKEEKTRYGSSAGRNWNLGLMLNKDNNITLGYRKKKELKNMVFAFGKDYKSGNRWKIEDAYHLAGELSYLSAVEKVYHDALMLHYEQKLDLDVSIHKALYDIINN